MRRRFEGAFAFVLLAIIVAAALNVEAAGARTTALVRARQIRATQALTEQLFAEYVSEQTAADGFLDTGRAQDLAPSDSGLANEQRLITSLRAALAGHARELTDVDAVSAAAVSWRAAAQRDIAAMRDGSVKAPAGHADRQSQRRLFALLVERVQTVQREATSALAVARADFDAASARVTGVLYVSLALAAGLLGVLLLLVQRWVLTPLGSILKAVEAVRDGAEDTTIPSLGPPELALLGAHVDEMRLAVLSRGRAAMQAESHLRLLIDSVPDCAILRLHLDGRPATWSAGAERLTGYTADQLLHQSTARLDLPDDPSTEVLRSALAQAADGQTVRARRRRQHADGTEIVVDNALSAIRDDAGQLLGFAVVARDVTAAVAAEHALNLAHEQLAERAARLQETTELQEATNRDLLAANQEMEAFSYTVSHDLRAPLRAIAGFSHILLQDHLEGLDAQAVHYLNRVATNATRMGQLIDDLLAFSKLRRFTLAKTATPLADVVHSAWEELEIVNRETEVVLQVAELPTLAVDPSLLRQVFVNLLGNAVKFSAATRHPHLDIECGADPQGSGQPVISVRDNGIGFDSSHASQLFDVFTRLHTEQEYEGTGIGLSIVQRIITRHGGRIWAQANPGQGAVFSFTLGPDTVPAPTPIIITTTSTGATTELARQPTPA
jgi:PAS domain S-box-containing protein